VGSNKMGDSDSEVEAKRKYIILRCMKTKQRAPPPNLGGTSSS
jgi:hypothetical protein